MNNIVASWGSIIYLKIRINSYYNSRMKTTLSVHGEDVCPISMPFCSINVKSPESYISCSTIEMRSMPYHCNQPGPRYICDTGKIGITTGWSLQLEVVQIFPNPNFIIVLADFLNFLPRGEVGRENTKCTVLNSFFVH